MLRCASRSDELDLAALGFADVVPEATGRPSYWGRQSGSCRRGVHRLHKVHKLLVPESTMLINALRGHLTEFGIVRARGRSGVKAAIEALHEAQNGLPKLARVVLYGLVDQRCITT
jgi:hypothetical protein